MPLYGFDFGMKGYMRLRYSIIFCCVLICCNKAYLWT